MSSNNLSPSCLNQYWNDERVVWRFHHVWRCAQFPQSKTGLVRQWTWVRKPSGSVYSGASLSRVQMCHPGPGSCLNRDPLLLDTTSTPVTHIWAVPLWLPVFSPSPFYFALSRICFCWDCVSEQRRMKAKVREDFTKAITKEVGIWGWFLKRNFWY